MPGLIERYRDRLPFDAGDPVVTLGEGSTPLVRAPRALRARRRRGVAEARGRQPDRLVQGPRDDLRGVSAAVREGAEAVICASTGNTAACAGRLRGAGRAARRGDRPRGQDRHRQARPGADARRARDRAARQLRRGAAARARARASSHPIALVNSRQRVPARGPEDGGASRSSRSSAATSTRSASRSATPATSPPTGRASARPAQRRGCSASRPPGAAPLVHGAPRRAARDDRQRDPDRQPGALGGGDERDDATRAARSRPSPTSRSSTPTGCSPSSEGIFCEPACAASVAGLLAHGAGGARARRLRADRPRPQGPADRARAGRRGRAVRARARRAIERAVLG